MPSIFVHNRVKDIEQVANIIKSDKGARGGYLLKSPLDKISLKKIVDVMEGGCAIVACAQGKNFVCSKKDKKCALKNKMKKINKKISDILSDIKLKEL